MREKEKQKRFNVSLVVNAMSKIFLHLPDDFNENVDYIVDISEKNMTV